jgi:hypothetical protein
MIKKIAWFLACLLIGSQSFASEVRVTRFFPLSENRLVGQICGEVHPPQEVLVRVIADYNTSAASVFSFTTTRSGQFCGVIGTVYGRALLTLDQFELFVKMSQ